MRKGKKEVTETKTSFQLLKEKKERTMTSKRQKSIDEEVRDPVPLATQENLSSNEIG